MKTSMSGAGLILLVLSATAALAAPTVHPRAGATPQTGVRFFHPPIKQTNLYVRVSQYLGEMSIDGWTSDPQDKYWTNIALSSRSLAMNFDMAKAWVDNCFNGPRCANKSTEWLGVATYNDDGASIDADYSQRVGTYFFRLSSPLSGQERHDTALKNYVAVGANTVHFKIAPHSPKWSVTLQFYTLADDGQEAVIQETHMDQSGGGNPGSVTITVTPP